MINFMMDDISGKRNILFPSEVRDQFKLHNKMFLFSSLIYCLIYSLLCKGINKAIIIMYIGL